MYRAMIFAALTTAVSACVGAEARASDLDAQARGVCVRIGLDVNEAPFMYCVMSLRESAAGSAEATRIEQARQECSNAGLRSGTPAFANCVLDRTPNIPATSGPVNNSYNQNPLGG